MFFSGSKALGMFQRQENIMQGIEYLMLGRDSKIQLESKCIYIARDTLNKSHLQSNGMQTKLTALQSRLRLFESLKCLVYFDTLDRCGKFLRSWHILHRCHRVHLLHIQHLKSQTHPHMHSSSPPPPSPPHMHTNRRSN